jgi:hypothetical protein
LCDLFIWPFSWEILHSRILFIFFKTHGFAPIIYFIF